MSFPEAIQAGFQNYVNFSGRALRSEYWFWFLFAVLAQAVLTIIDFVSGIGLLAILFSLACLLPGIAVSVRRLHDLDKSGWFLFIAAIPIVGAIILIIWFCQEGTRGANRFGTPQTVAA